MTDYVVDTMALAKHLDDTLPPRPARIFREAEGGDGHLLLPEIALAEFVHLSLKGRIPGVQSETSIREVIHNLRASPYLSISAMSPRAWEAFVDLPIPEMHNRMIAADALARRIPVISNDPVFSMIEHLRVVW